MRAAATAAVVACIASFVFSFGCVSAEHDAWVEARDALRECEAAHPTDPGQCAELAAQADQLYQHYERTAQRSWGCENAPERCADHRRPGE